MILRLAFAASPAMQNAMLHALALLAAYLIGSIPFGLLLAKAAGKGDIRQIGSGNIGATNVLRTGSKGLAAAVLLLDASKGLAVVLAAWRWFPDGISITALAVVIGHCFPIWLRFNGGKGVATNAGICFGLGWPIGLAYAAVWLTMLALTRISSLAGMSAVVAAVIAAPVLGFERFVPVLTAIALLVLWLHRANIARLLKGEEPKVGSKS
jgi:glycerol-3-phosphate acyltransferase PlsY